MTKEMSFWNHKTWTWLGILLGLSLFIGLGIILAPQNPTQYPAYLTESPSPTGVKAFYTLLDKNFAQLEIWKKPAGSLLPSASGQLMIIVEPSTHFGPTETAYWTKWLKAGNRLLLVAHYPQGIFSGKFAPTTTPTGKNTTPIESLTGSEEWNGTYQAVLETDVRLVPEPKDRILLNDQLGVVALSRVYGQGELMVLLAPEWMTNGMILQQDHFKLVFPFILRADPKVIWFNDYVHGNSNLPTVLRVYPEWFLVLLAQVSVTCLLWLWYKGKRFGSIQTPREEVVRFGDERIRAIAAWYERGRFYKESLLIQDNFLRQTVQERWGILANLEEQEFIETAILRMPPELQKQWLQNWRELKEGFSNKISHQAFLKWSKLLDDMQKEVEHR
ncbi:MAG: DUF4350 domain-containing protein [Desulfitobacteriaceae bacterium]